MKRITVAILALLAATSLSSCSLDDITGNEDVNKAVAFGQCVTPDVLKCIEATYGGDVTLTEARILSEQE